MVQLLVESGAGIDARRGDGRTPALCAIYGFHRYWRRENKQKILQYFLDQGAAYSLLVAASSGDQERVSQLLRTDPDQVNAADPIGRRPLSGAADIGHAEIVRLLLEAGADPNSRELLCKGGWSLRAATLRNDYDVAKLLLDFGAVPDHGADSMGNPIEHAMQHGFDRIVSLLYAAGGTCGIRMYAMLHRIDVVAEMLNQDPSLANSVLPGGWKGEPHEEQAYDIMRLAIRHGARFEDQGSWSLRWTLRRYPTVYRLLQDHGADPNQPLLGIAGDGVHRYDSQQEMVRLLRYLVEECGADLDCRDKDGLTPLAVAARQGSDKVVEYLLEAGAATTTQGPDWTQPLALAKHHDHGAVIDLLVR